MTVSLRAFLAAFTALPDTASRTCYDRKTSRRKEAWGAALICPARGRCNVRDAMLKKHEPSRKPPQKAHDSTFAALTATLAMNPIVKQLLAAGLTHTHVARTVHLRKQQVGIIARTPFHPLPLAAAILVDA